MFFRKSGHSVAPFPLNLFRVVISIVLFFGTLAFMRQPIFGVAFFLRNMDYPPLFPAQPADRLERLPEPVRVIMRGRKTFWIWVGLKQSVWGLTRTSSKSCYRC